MLARESGNGRMANTLQAFYGPNAGYALELYERYQQDPNSVDAETRAFFDQLAPPVTAAPSGPTATATAPPAPAPAPAARPAIAGDDAARVVGAARPAPSTRQFGPPAAAAGTREVLIGMAHRGRLNVLAHVLGKPYARIFAEFHHAPNKDLVPSEGSSGINYGWTGDVKYHLGASKALREGDLVQVMLHLAHNPSHLEFVNPVVEGAARASQDRRNAPGLPRQDVDTALPVVIHGDAAFPGEGV